VIPRAIDVYESREAADRLARTVLTSARLRAASPKQERVTRRAATLVPRKGSRVIYTGERQAEVPSWGTSA
jgi:hypothetical protein